MKESDKVKQYRLMNKENYLSIIQKKTPFLKDLNFLLWKKDLKHPLNF